MAVKSSKDKSLIGNVSDKEKALEHALDEIQKAFGKGAVMKLGDEGLHNNIEGISTGSISLDVATGIVVFPVAVLLRFMDLNHQERQLLHCTASQRLRRLAVRQRLSTLNMR